MGRRLTVSHSVWTVSSELQILYKRPSMDQRVTTYNFFSLPEDVISRDWKSRDMSWSRDGLEAHFWCPRFWSWRWEKCLGLGVALGQNFCCFLFLQFQNIRPEVIILHTPFFSWSFLSVQCRLAFNSRSPFIGERVMQAFLSFCRRFMYLTFLISNGVNCVCHYVVCLR